MRSHYCGQLGPSLIDMEVELCGWVNRRRDHGGVIFIDLRDREGLAQVVFDPEYAEPFAIADATSLIEKYSIKRLPVPNAPRTVYIKWFCPAKFAFGA